MKLNLSYQSIHIFILHAIFHQCCTYKFLVVFPLPRKSHQILGGAYVKHLLNAGHEVTYITSKPLNESSPNIHQVDISSLNAEFLIELSILKKYNNIIEKNCATYFKDMLTSMFWVANATLYHKNVQDLMHDPKQRFDAVIAEYMFSMLYSGFSSVFNCPLIWSTSMEPHNVYISLIDGVHNPAYTYNFLTDGDPPFSFLQRVTELYRVVIYHYIMWSLSGKESESFNNAFGSAVRLRGRELPPFHEVCYNASLILGNSDMLIGHPQRLPPAYKQIAGYHIFDTLSLPKRFQDLMDKSRDGVIYFSLGSIFRCADLSDDIKTGFLKVFNDLQQTIIWNCDKQLDNLPKNVHIVSWAPQQAILAHRNCQVFITHGGLLSIIEAVHFGIPVIGLPVFADQFINVDRSVRKGFGKRVNLAGNPAMPMELKRAIDDVLKNSKYKEKAMEHSRVYHHRLIPPGDELIHWVEHAVRTQGAPHLRSPVLQVPLYQRLYLDLIAIISITILLFIKLVKYISNIAKMYFNYKKKYI